MNKKCVFFTNATHKVYIKFSIFQWICFNIFSKYLFHRNKSFNTPKQSLSLVKNSTRNKYLISQSMVEYLILMFDSSQASNMRNCTSWMNASIMHNNKNDTVLLLFYFERKRRMWTSLKYAYSTYPNSIAKRWGRPRHFCLKWTIPSLLASKSILFFFQNPPFIAMQILTECKRSLSYAGLGIDKTINIGGMKIPRILVRAWLSLVIFSLGISEVIIGIHYYPIDLQLFLYPLGCLLFFVVKISMYMALISKTDVIAELIEYLQSVVTQRNVSRVFGWWSIWLKKEGIEFMNCFFDVK